MGCTKGKHAPILLIKVEDNDLKRFGKIFRFDKETF